MSEKYVRIAYRQKYFQMRALFALSATCFMFAMAVLYGAARANIEMRQELMMLESSGKLVVVK
jgi:hypothetical protein